MNTCTSLFVDPIKYSFVKPLNNALVRPFAMRLKNGAFVQKVADLFDRAISFLNETKQIVIHPKLQGICQAYSKLLDLYLVKEDFETAGKLMSLESYTREVNSMISASNVSIDLLRIQIVEVLKESIQVEDEKLLSLASDCLDKLFPFVNDPATGLKKQIVYESKKEFIDRLKTCILKPYNTLFNQSLDTALPQKIEKSLDDLKVMSSVEGLVGNHCLALCNVVATLTICQDFIVFGINALAKIAGSSLGQFKVFGGIFKETTSKRLDSIFGKAIRVFAIVGFCSKAIEAGRKLIDGSLAKEQKRQAGYEFFAYTAETVFFAFLSSSGFGVFVVGLELIRIWNAPGSMSLKEANSLLISNK